MGNSYDAAASVPLDVYVGEYEEVLIPTSDVQNLSLR